MVRYPGNWKFQAENIVDEYHFMHTHKGFVQLQMKYGDSTGDFGVHKGGSAKTMRDLRFRGSTWNCTNGHGLVEKPVVDPDALLEGDFGEYHRGLLDKHGEIEFSFMTRQAHWLDLSQPRLDSQSDPRLAADFAEHDGSRGLPL